MFSNNLVLITSFLPLSLTKYGNLEVFHKYLKPTCKKLCEIYQDNWHKYINQVLNSYPVTPNLATAETPLFLVCGRDPNLHLHQLLQPMHDSLVIQNLDV